MLSILKRLSKRTRIILILIVAIIVISWVVLLNMKNSFSYSKPGQGVVIPKLTLDNLSEKDTDGDEIPDWEEALWGTDPTKKETILGTNDKDYIERKRKDLQSQTGVTADSINPNDTDKFSQDFLKTIVSLKQSGNLNQESINAVAQTVGQSMSGNPIPQPYFSKDVKITAQTYANTKKYMEQMEGIIAKYGNMNNGPGEEMAILGEGLENEDETKAIILSKIGDLYIEMAKELIKTGVPIALSGDHLKLTNAAAQTGTSIKNMSQSFTNPVIGIGGIAQYYTYSENLDEVFSTIEAYFEDNDITL